MTDQTSAAAEATDNTGGGVLAAVGGLNSPVSDIKAMTAEIVAHIDAHDIGETESTWLASAREALRCAVAYVEGHFKALEDAAKAEIAAVEAKLDEPMTSTDAAAAGAATAASAS